MKSVYHLTFNQFQSISFLIFDLYTIYVFWRLFTSWRFYIIFIIRFNNQYSKFSKYIVQLIRNRLENVHALPTDIKFKIFVNENASRFVIFWAMDEGKVFFSNSFVVSIRRPLKVLIRILSIIIDHHRSPKVFWKNSVTTKTVKLQTIYEIMRLLRMFITNRIQAE